MIPATALTRNHQLQIAPSNKPATALALPLKALQEAGQLKNGFALGIDYKGNRKGNNTLKKPNTTAPASNFMICQLHLFWLTRLSVPQTSSFN
jgi:hypothetical protein